MNATDELKSTSISILPILVGLSMFNEHEGLPGIKGCTQEHSLLLEDFSGKNIPKLSKDQLETLISNNPKELNLFLKRKGFDIQLDEKARMDLGFVGIMDLVGNWLGGELTETSILNNRKEYPACTAKKNVSVFITQEDTKIVRLETDSGLYVHFAVDARHNDDLNLHINCDFYGKSIEKMNPEKGDFHVTFPMIDFNQEADISWVKGITIGKLQITQALQQNKLKMNCLGVRAQSATALGAVRSMSMAENIIFDEPFYCWITTKDNTMPIFTAYLEKDSWKDPLEL